MSNPLLKVGALALAVSASSAAGCGSTPPVTTGTTGGEMPPPPANLTRLTHSSVDKLDLLLMIDNSRSMADKQAVLAAAIPDLVAGLVNPRCVDAMGVPSPQQPQGPLDPCPDPATTRRSNPILDIHIGIVTSSLGSHGADSCPDVDHVSCAGGINTTNNDHGHLVSRLDACGGGTAPTYLGKGFLAWDPGAKHMKDPNPKVHSAALGAINFDVTTGVSTTTTPGIIPDLKDMVLGVGQIGCGYESQLEGWYRFLIDPDPPQSIMLDAQQDVQRVGIDNVLLQQRKDFLRASSLLAILVISDENDASVKESGQNWIIGQQRDPQNPNKNFYMPKARHECATNPNDMCCRSCAADQTGCPTDPNCPGTYDAKADDVNLREWDQKRRFGIDFYYPVQRYVDGLTLPTVLDSKGQSAPNPIFSQLDPSSGENGVRDPSLVFLAAVVGVPWQDIARDPKDLTKGVKNAGELAQLDAHAHTTWDYIIGDPANYVPPLDPHMIESNAPRIGTDPITGVVLAPTTAPAGADAINGHEYTPGTKMGIQTVANDLEYACIFDLPQPRDCSDPNVAACECADPKNDNPLCDADPSKGGARTLQARAKAYPSIRELQLVKGLGSQGIVGSICPAQLKDPSKADFGYRPSIQAILDRLTSAADGACFPKPLVPDAAGQVACTIIEGTFSPGKTCCAGQPGRRPVPAEHAALLAQVKADPASKALALDCFCELEQLGGAPSPGCSSIASGLSACQCDASQAPLLNGKPVDGWCYVDAAETPLLSNPAIVKSCPDGDKRILRFVGGGAPSNGATTFMACAGL